VSDKKEMRTKLSNYHLKFYKFNSHKNPISAKEFYYDKKCKELKDQGEILAFSEDQNLKSNEEESRKRSASNDFQRKKLGWFSSSNLIESRDDEYEDRPKGVIHSIPN